MPKAYFSYNLSKRLSLLFLSVILLAFSSFATHIVGGALTYVHNGGSSYTFTLKLYRDCGPTSANFPADLDFTVLGYDGMPFTPSKDFTMVRGTITDVPSNLDPCAEQPDPMPCVEEGIYQLTVNNMPPNPGGYHIYVQYEARNLSLTNTDATCNCLGESFYAYIPGTSVVWYEDFDFANSTIVDAGATAWSRTLGAIPANYAMVNNSLFEISGNDDGEASWTSEVIDISTFPLGVSLSLNVSENGDFDANDSLLFYYSLDGGPLTAFENNGFFANDFGTSSSSTNVIVGNNVQIFVRAHYDSNSPGSELYRIDNVFVYSHDFESNNNPTFNLFPPLFVCVNQALSFDHAATDSNGDSLVYTFYEPYNGDNDIGGALDPTFSNNEAIFTPIVWEPGFSMTNPLGGGGLSLNSETGFLSGTPTMLGQYVVGIKVDEYRDGVYISSTLRDFQFNVIDCPIPPEALLDPIVVCNGLSHNFANDGTKITTSTFDWYFGDPTTATDFSSSEFPSYTYPDTGQYIVRLIMNEGTVCADTAETTVDVGFITTDFSLNNPECVGTPVDFTDESISSNNSDVITWVWAFDDGGATSAIQDPSHTYNTAGTYDVTLTATNDIGCTDTEIISLTVDPINTANANVDQVVCANDPNVVINASVTNASGGTWTSTGTGTFSPNVNTVDVTYIPSDADTALGVLTLTLETVSNNSCPSVSNSMNVTITDAPSANVGGDIGLCEIVFNPIPLNGSVKVATGGEWTTTGTGTFDPDEFDLNAEYIPSADDITNGGVTLTLTTTGNGDCLAESDNLILVLTTNIITSDAGNDTTMCAPEIQLDGEIAFAGGGKWTTSGTGTFSPNDSTLNAIYTFSDADTLAGNVQLTLTTTGNGACAAKQSIMNIDLLDWITAEISTNAVTCFNGDAFTISATSSTGAGEWSHNGNGGFVFADNVIENQYLPVTSDVNTTVTFVFTTTNNGICAAYSDTFLVFIKEGPSLTNSSTDIPCKNENNGTAQVFTNGGSAPYDYLWDAAAGSGTASSVSGLAPGTYQVSVTDNMLCMDTSYIIITEPSDVLNISSSTVIGVSCFDGSDGNIDIDVYGGTVPYNYQWSNGETDSQISSLSAQTYSVTITDANSCTTAGSLTITQPSAALSITSSSVSNVSCNNGSDGSIELVNSGGTSPYTYEWSDGNSTELNENLSAGSYSVTVTDSKNCTVENSYTLTEPSNPIAINLTPTAVNCFGGSDGLVTSDVTGGVSPYSYLWNNGTSNATLTGISTGTYVLTITDQNNCQENNIASISVSQPSAALSITRTFTNVSCFGGSDGEIITTTDGGTFPYTYNWSNGQTSYFSNTLTAGVYTVTVTDANGCTVKTSATTITEPTALNAAISSTNVFCFGGSTGSAIASGSGGTASYSFEWSTNQNSASIFSLSQNTYTVTVTDNKGCTSQTEVFIDQPNVLDVVTTDVITSCFLSSDGSITTSINGGTSPYTYLWTNGQTGEDAVSLAGGVFTVTVTDANLCKAIVSDTVPQPEAISLVGNPIADTICPGNSTVIGALAEGGNGNYIYTWDNGLGGGQSHQVTPSETTVYTAFVTDENACTSNPATVTVNVMNLENNTLDITRTEDICLLESTEISATFEEKFPPYTYQWSPINLNALGTYTVAPNTPTWYYVSVSDQCNQTIVDSVFVDVFPLPNLSLAPVFGEGCQPLTVSFSNSSLNTIPVTYNWSFGDGFISTEANPTHNYVNAGTYNVKLTLTSDKGCVSTSATSSVVTVNPLPEVVFSATPKIATIENATISFTNKTNGGDTYKWTYGDGTYSTEFDENHTYKDTGKYTVTLVAVSEFGCIDSISDLINIQPVFDIKVPNAFMPSTSGSNGGKYDPNNPDNTVFYPITGYVKEYKLQIFNRWGEMIFESFDINTGWNGYYRDKILQQDVYVWKLYVKYADDNETEANKVGDVLLLR